MSLPGIPIVSHFHVLFDLIRKQSCYVIFQLVTKIWPINIYWSTYRPEFQVWLFLVWWTRMTLTWHVDAKYPMFLRSVGDTINADIFTSLVKRLTRAQVCGGVWTPPPPCGFFGIAQKRRRAAPPFLVYLTGHPFPTFPENFRPRSPQVRSPGQSKWPNLQKTLGSSHGHSGWQKVLKLSGLQ